VRAIAPHRQALSDQLEAYLRINAPLPVGTTELCTVAGKVAKRWPCTCKTCGHVHDGPVCYYPARNHDVTPLLVRLERAGLVERHRVPHVKGNGSGQHYWRWIGPDCDSNPPESGSTLRQYDGSSSWPAIGADESEKSRPAPRKLPTDEDGNPQEICPECQRPVGHSDFGAPCTPVDCDYRAALIDGGDP
jgi:hypothetical protein